MTLWKEGSRARVVLAVVMASAAIVLLVRSIPIPEAPPHARAVPDFAALPSTHVCWAEFARRKAPGPAAMAGWSTRAVWDVTTSGLLVRHPKGDILIDTGFSSRYDEEIAEYPLLGRTWLRLLRSNKVLSTPDAVRAAGGDPERLSWVILSHAHVDHAGGMVDLPRVPVLAPQEEIDFIARYANEKTPRKTAVVPQHARAVEGRTHAIPFERKPYENFDESADLFGDGAIVNVKLSGHTPGSVGTFVNVSPSFRIFYVGDTVNVADAIEARRPKSIVMSSTDDDGDAAAAVVAKLAQLHAMAPEVFILPAHDRGQWERIFGSNPTCR